MFSMACSAPGSGSSFQLAEARDGVAVDRRAGRGVAVVAVGRVGDRVDEDAGRLGDAGAGRALATRVREVWRRRGQEARADVGRAVGQDHDRLLGVGPAVVLELLVGRVQGLRVGGVAAGWTQFTVETSGEELSRLPVLEA